MEKQKLSLDKQAEIQIMKADDIKVWKQTAGNRMQKSKTKAANTG